jgi:adenylate cyclase
MVKLLYIEDNEDNIYMLTQRLTKQGFEVLVARDGEHGVALALAERPALVLMDLSLPVVDGWEAARRLKEDPGTKSIPVIALSAHAMAGDREKALTAGCDDYDTKPVDFARLLSKIRTLLSEGGRALTDGEARILVVDDNEDNRYTLTRRLRHEGWTNVAVANDGRQALELLLTQPFDLVLLDLMMPEMSGDEVLARLQLDPERRDIPVIMISATTELDSVVHCIKLGAVDYLPKPFNPVLLRARVGACLERKRLHDQEKAHIAEIEHQRRRADQLLHAILPARAVEELKATNSVLPRRFEEVAILIADVIGFTAWCDTHPPEDVVANLNRLVGTFEGLARRHGLEKIKTVGDALIATAGLLEPHKDEVMAALRCAVETIAAAEQLPIPWQMRAGVHLGPVVAGVVGQEKFSFDLWGDTVNVTARLAGYGAVEGVHLSAAAWERVRDRVGVEALGPVPIKGKGEMEIFRLVSLTS